MMQTIGCTSRDISMVQCVDFTVGNRSPFPVRRLVDFA